MINLKPGGSLTIWTKFLIKNLTLIIKIKLAYMARNMFIQKTLIMRISTYIIQTHKNYDNIYVFKKGSSYKVK